MARQALVMGIDVGGQTTKLGVVDARGNILYQSVISSLQRELSSYVEDLTTAIKDLIKQSENDGEVKGIGIGAPNGNYYKGTIEFAPNLKWAYDENDKPMVIFFAKMIRDIVGIPVAITNDANAAAVGEMTYGIAKGMKDFIMITLGTGVGSGIVIDGKIVYGHDGFAGELGHTTIIRGGRQCNCGRKGCLETYTSATGVARTAREFLTERDEPSLLRNLDPEKITSKDIYDAATKGDKLAIERGIQRTGGDNPVRRSGQVQGVPDRVHPREHERQPAEHLERQDPSALLYPKGLRRSHPRRLCPRLGTLAQQ